MRNLLVTFFILIGLCSSNVGAMVYYPAVVNPGVDERTALLTYATSQPQQFDASVRLLLDELEQKLEASKHDAELLKQVAELRLMYLALEGKIDKKGPGFVKKTIKVLIFIALIGVAAQLVYTGLNTYHAHNKKVYPDKNIFSVFGSQFMNDVKGEKNGIIDWWKGKSIDPRLEML
jgi:hypothetical protein